MYKNFEEYQKRYFEKYYKQVSKIETNKKYSFSLFAKQFSFLSFVLVFSYFVLFYDANVNSKYNSEEVNMMYSQKFIDNDDIYYNSIHLNKISLPKKIKIDPYLSSENHKINLSSLNATLPKNSLPLDWQKSFSLKKVEFIETLLPLIAYQNQQILVERERLFKIQNYLLDNKTLNKNDLEYLSAIADKYLIETNNQHKIDIVDKLLLSVNIIPTSIVLAQAATESGWGTSRFAKEYNALFGQYTYNEKKGVIPYEREIGKKHLIKHFSSLDKSVESYFKNINTHYAYEKFRSIRNSMHEDNLDIKLLTQALDVYAEDKSYVDTINSIIDSNEFTQFDLRSYIFTSS
ncbi:MAG: glucosaminidase domain-containing protein [Alphaproteobacteria bacterium]